MRMVGPVLLRELVGSLRAPRAFVTLLLFNAAVGAAVVLAWTWAEAQPLARAEVGRTLFLIVSLTQVALLTLLAPALSGGAITLERERGTMDLLRTLPIPTHRLLMEKFLAGTVFFLILMITATPLTALSLLLGGVTQSDVLGVVLMLFLLITACGAVGVTLSTVFLRTHSAVSVTYLVLLPVGGLFASITYSAGARQMAMAAVGLGIAGIGLGLALWAVSRRLLDAREEREVEADSYEDVAVHAGLLFDRRVFPDNIVWPPRRNEPIPEKINPVLEKDLRLEAPGRSGRMLSVLIQGGLYLSLPVLIFPALVVAGTRAKAIFDVQSVVYPVYLLLFVLLISSAFSATSFSGERERKTLDLLASTPLSPWQVVWGKAIAALRGSLGITGLLAVPYLIFAFTQQGAFPREFGRVAIFLLIFLVTAGCVTFGGLWISLRARSSLRAMFMTYAVVALVAVVPVLAFRLMEPFTGFRYDQFRWIAIPSPVAALFSGASTGGGASILPLDPEGGMATWVLFLVFWGAILPLLLAGSLQAYRKISNQ